MRLRLTAGLALALVLTGCGTAVSQDQSTELPGSGDSVNVRDHVVTIYKPPT